MISSLRRWSIAALAAALAALVAAWFRHREPEVLDEAAPGTAAWPPLVPISEPPPAPTAASAAVESSAWVGPDPEGGCPLTHPVKAKERSGIYHVIGGLAYERTNADRCYVDNAAAEADGFRAAKR